MISMTVGGKGGNVFPLHRSPKQKCADYLAAITQFVTVPRTTKLPRQLKTAVIVFDSHLFSFVGRDLTFTHCVSTIVTKKMKKKMKNDTPT